MSAELIMLVGGVSSFVLTLHWVRSRELREKYAVGWVLIAGFLLLCGLFPGVIKAAADASRLSYPAAVLFVALTLVYGFAFSISVSLTRQHRARTKTLQQVALLEERLAKAERELRELRASPESTTAHEERDEVSETV